MHLLLLQTSSTLLKLFQVTTFLKIQKLIFNLQINNFSVKHKVDPIKALENPNLFGGDILGVQLRVNESIPVKNITFNLSI